jgi:hypothetical protein
MQANRIDTHTRQVEPARTPFYFNTSASLLRITGVKATTAGELLAGLYKCPENSIFQHSYRTLEEHHFIRAGYTNDFAHWARSACREPKLAEVLSQVDIREFTSVESLRERFIEIVQNFLKSTPEAITKTARRAFYFCLPEIVVIPTTCIAYSLREFVEGVRGVSVHSLHHHFIEARLRLKLMSNDFSEWLAAGGLKDAAHQLNRIDIYTVTLEDIREQTIRTVERMLV